MNQEDLFNYIKHGSQVHQDWLKEAINSYFNGLPRPEVRDISDKEKLISVFEEIGIPYSKGIQFNIRTGDRVSNVQSVDTFVITQTELQFDEHGKYELTKTGITNGT